MTNTEKVIHLARLDGVEIPTGDFYVYGTKFISNGDNVPVGDVPNYLHSFDAVISVIRKQPENIRFVVLGRLLDQVSVPGNMLISNFPPEILNQFILKISPTDLCNALLFAHQIEV